MLEKNIENSILSFLSCIPDCFAWKNNSTGIYDEKRKVFRRPMSKYLINGVADIIGIYKGKFLAIEVKTPKRKSMLSDNQKNFLYQINRGGGIAFVATSIDDVKKILSAWGQS